MLIKESLSLQISQAIFNAMKSAYIEALNTSKNQSSDNFNIDMVASAFADKAKECSKDIASAIDSYIKSAVITLPLGTTMTPIPSSLISPAGPITGTLTLGAPTMLFNAIS